MLTQCPQCETFFRLTAPQLRAARGMVRCGECDHLFNALDHLHEHIPPSYKPVTDAGDEHGPSEQVGESETSEPEVQTDLVVTAEDETDTERQVAGHAEQDISLDEFMQADPQQMSLDEISADADDTDPMDILIEPPSSAEDLMSEKLNLADLEDLPEALMEDLQAEADTKRSALSIILWSLGIFLLIMGLVTQLGVSFQTEIEQRLPATRALYEKLCTHLPCQTALRHEPVAIKLVARDVRHHPRFRNTLLVNGTLLNESSQMLAYPVLQFELLDPTGTVIGVRQFQPAEYLDKSIAIDEGMPPGRPVHIVMEVLGASESAVSFEFSFL